MFRAGHCGGNNRHGQCVCNGDEPGDAEYGRGSGNDAGRQWNGAAEQDQYAGEYSGGVHQLDRAVIERVQHTAEQCQEWKYRANGYGDGGDQYCA